MAGNLNAFIRSIAAFVVVFICLSSGRAYSDTVKMNVFERFRNEMTIAHDVAAAKFMSPAALAKWNSTMVPYFDKRDRQMSHFFAFSMLVPKIDKADFYITFFNPWVDGALLTHWRKTDGNWRIENFYMASGERIRGSVTAQSVVSKAGALPVWLRYKGTFMKTIYTYYGAMRAILIKKDLGEYMSWFLLSDKERNSDLLRVQQRMAMRLNLAVLYLVKHRSGPMLAGAFSKLKYDSLVKDKKSLASYTPHADILVKLRPEITNTWRENWFLKGKDIYTVILSSPVMPRLFLFMRIHSNGKIKGVLLGDLESMATMLRKKAAKAKPARPVAPLRPTKKVQRYKAPNGDQIEITTEKRGGKVVMTTRRNGVVTEVLTF